MKNQKSVFGFVNSVINVETKQMEDLLKEKQFIPADKLEAWEKDDYEVATQITKELAQWLFPRPHVYVFPKDSAADQHFKVDVMFTFPAWSEADPEGNKIDYPERKVIFQIKTHEGQAETFLHMYGKKGVTYKGQSYPCPGVWWVQGDLSWQKALTLAKFTNSLIHPELEKGIKLLQKLRDVLGVKSPQGTYLEYRKVKAMLSPFVWEGLQALNLITLAGGRVIYRFK